MCEQAGCWDCFQAWTIALMVKLTGYVRNGYEGGIIDGNARRFWWKG
jgi:hypothetical protein